MSDQDPPIESLTVSAYTVPTDAPEADGTLAWDSTTMVVVHAAGAGQRGVGWTYAPATAGRFVEQTLAAVVTGLPALDPTSAWERMVAAVRNAGRPGLVGCAISAVDMALWDL